MSLPNIGQKPNPTPPIPTVSAQPVTTEKPLEKSVAAAIKASSETTPAKLTGKDVVPLTLKPAQSSLESTPKETGITPKEAIVTAAQESSGTAISTLRQQELAALARMEQQALNLGANELRFIATVPSTLVTIPMDTLHKRAKIVMDLVPVGKVIPTSSTPCQREFPHSNVRYPNYQSIKPSSIVHFGAQAKGVLPSRMSATSVLLLTQGKTQKVLEKYMDPTTATTTSWLLGVAAENSISTPTKAARQQIQTGRATNFWTAAQQVYAAKGIKGFFKGMGLNTISGFSVSVSLNQISPYFTKVVETGFGDLPIGSQILIPLATGAGGGLISLPVSSLVHAINHHQHEPHDKRTVAEIVKNITLGEWTKEMRHGSKRIMLTGAVYNAAFQALQLGQERVKVKHLEKVKETASVVASSAGKQLEKAASLIGEKNSNRDSFAEMSGIF